MDVQKRFVIYNSRTPADHAQRRYDISSGIQAFQVNWISKASAAQRAGRAGRTGPGHCYRLYSSALFEHHFDAFSQPELLRMPIDGVVLQMKSMHIDTVVNFPFPTPPDRTSLHKAETTLTHLGALSGGHITELGKMMSLFPLSPRFSRMLVGGQQHKCLPYVIAIVSALSVGDPFIHDETLRSDGAEVEDEDEFSTHLTSDKLRQKELLRATRKTYFASQHVCFTLPRIYLGLTQYCRSTHLLATTPVTSSKCYQLSARMNMQAVATNSAGIILFDSRYRVVSGTGLHVGSLSILRPWKRYTSYEHKSATSFK